MNGENVTGGEYRVTTEEGELKNSGVQSISEGETAPKQHKCYWNPYVNGDYLS